MPGPMSHAYRSGHLDEDKVKAKAELDVDGDREIERGVGMELK